MGGQFVVASGADWKISHTLKELLEGCGKLMKREREMMRQKEMKKGMQDMQLTPGTYRLEQDHPGHGHSGVPGRTGPACGRHQTNKCSLNSGLHVEACCFTPSRAIAGRAVMIEFVASRSNEWCSFAGTLVLP